MQGLPKAGWPKEPPAFPFSIEKSCRMEIPTRQFFACFAFAFPVRPAGKGCKA